MTEQALRNKIVSIAQKYIGCNEADGSHRKIIDLYNSHKPLAVGYKVTYTDAWCSAFASAVAIEAGLTDIIPTECGCERHVNLFKKHSKSRWEEDGTYTPDPGDYIFYNWDDSTQPNDGSADHVGIVEKISGNTITVIEGNCDNAVKRRTLSVGNGYIRGYGLPAYATYIKEHTHSTETASIKKDLIDVSTWQGDIDWVKVANSGIHYAMIRSSFGVENPNQVDNKFVRNITNATKAGVKCGVYHYSYAKSAAEAKREAEFCLKTIKSYKLDLPVAFDIEDSSQTGLGRRVCTDMVIAFCDTIKAAGYKPMLYCNPNWLVNYLYKDELLNKYDIWLANWGVSAPIYDCAIWQYSEKGSVPGISGTVDMNYLYKEYNSSKKPSTGNSNNRQPVDINADKKPVSSFKVGDKVKVKNPIIYGTSQKFRLYNDVYDVIEVSGDRIVIGIGKDVTAAVASSNLRKASNSSQNTTGSSTNKPVSSTLKVGDKVKVKNPIIYGTNQKFQLYNDVYNVIEISGNRVVIGVGKEITSAIDVSNIVKVNTTKTSTTSIKIGDKVRVKNPIIYGTNQKFTVYDDVYDVIEVSGDRVVIGIGKDVTAPISAQNLTKA